MNGTALETVIDVRTLPPRERHATIFRTWTDLSSAETMVVASDHDPIPLYYQFACEYGGTFRWEPLEQGPDTWRVRLTKGSFADPGYAPKAKMAAPERKAPPVAGPVVVDVRPIFARGETPCAAIDAAAAQVMPGQSLVLLVPFEPMPLYSKLGRQGFEGQPEQLEDGSFRITFKRTSAGTGEAASCGCSH